MAPMSGPTIITPPIAVNSPNNLPVPAPLVISRAMARDMTTPAAPKPLAQTALPAAVPLGAHRHKPRHNKDDKDMMTVIRRPK